MKLGNWGGTMCSFPLLDVCFNKGPCNKSETYYCSENYNKDHGIFLSISQAYKG